MCEHFTQGDHCEVCKDGYYGNATLGTADDCKPCACPLMLPSNNFSPKCELDEEYNDTIPQQYYCTECPVGYVGDFCEEWVELWIN